ncbi:hypothetical protein DFH29DRAFT_937585 [Suillus ampliporus]|nr:hypothetical protein DFH29DRAFT_937585 [Suillus ampliporus]
MSYNWANHGFSSAPAPLLHSLDEMFQCFWGGSHCDHIFHGHELSAHLRKFHGIQGPDNLHIYCLWDSCNMELNKENLSRHVEEKHLRIIYPCDTCCKTFTRRYNLKKHKKKCPGQQR